MQVPNISLAITIKHRVKAGEIEGMNIVGEIKGKHCIIVDDMIDTAGTLCKSAESLKEMGALSVPPPPLTIHPSPLNPREVGTRAWVLGQGLGCLGSGAECSGQAQAKACACRFARVATCAGVEAALAVVCRSLPSILIYLHFFCPVFAIHLPIY